MINYPFNFTKLIGTFRERDNRFVLSATINSKLSKCYLPNPGRLWELLIPNKTELMVFENSNSERFPYTVLASKKGQQWVLLHTHLTNKIIKELITEKSISYYKEYKVISEEVKVENSRFDFLLSSGDERLYLEVKTCTLFGDKIAMFPDAVTIRGKRHLNELKNISQKGFKSSVLFVIMSPEIDFFLPAYHIDYEFAHAFMDVKDFIDIKAIALDWDSTISYVTQVKELEIPYSFIQKTLKDKGIYILVIQKNKNELLRIGQLGEILFPAGYYAYVGSAKNGLFRRIKRHKRKTKKNHWHIDYFLNSAKLIKDIPIITQENLECNLSCRLEAISDGIILDFGCSDCKCKSHLFYFRENPILNHHFIELINNFRIDILKI